MAMRASVGGQLTPPPTVLLALLKALPMEAGDSTSTRLTLLLGFTRSLLSVQPASRQAQLLS